MHGGIAGPAMPVLKRFESSQYKETERDFDLLNDVDIQLQSLAVEDEEEDKSVTAITKPQVRKSDIAQFEAWMKKIGHSAKAFPGHAGVTVLSPEQSLIDSSFDHDIFEFICILKFHDFTSLKTWLYSSERATLLNEAKAFIQNKDDEDYWSIQKRDVAKLDLASWMKKAPPKKQRPPPKWKSYAIITVEVFLVNICYFYMKVFDGIYKKIPNYALAEFFVIGSLVVPLVFCVSPCFTHYLKPWLDLPRFEPKWEPLCLIMDILNDGFSLFEVRITTNKEEELETHLKMVETKVNRLRSVAQRQRKQIGVLVQHLRKHLPSTAESDQRGTTWTSLFSRPSMVNMAEADSIHSTPLNTIEERAVDPELGLPLEYSPSAQKKNVDAQLGPTFQPPEGANTSTTPPEAESAITALRRMSTDVMLRDSVTIGETFHVKWEYSEAFEDFAQRSLRNSLMRNALGFKSMDMIYHNDDGVGQAYTLIYRFSDYNCLQQWLNSGLRKNVTAEIQPFLEEQVHVATLGRGRFIRDAFSDLLVTRGSNVMTLPPPLWKTILLTQGGAYLAVWPSSYWLAPLVRAHFPGSMAPLGILFSTMVNFWWASYLGIPFVSFFFAQWLRMPRKPRQHPSVAAVLLDRGLPSPEYKMAATVLYFLFIGLLAGYHV